MAPNLVSYFGSVRLGDIELPSSLRVEPETSVADAVASMASAGQSGAVVGDAAHVLGMFTERDIATKVAAAPDRWSQPVTDFMTPDPFMISANLTAVDALRSLNAHRIRNLPVLDKTGDHIATLTFFDLIRLASTYLRSHEDTGHDITTEASLRYIDLTGIEPHPALQIGPEGSVADAITMMIEGHTGLVSVVDERGAVMGEFTEHDVLSKIACRVTDLEDEVVGDWFTEVIAGTRPTTSIADGLHLMADVGHRYLVLVSETGRALGVLTFRDIAEYFEAALQVN